MYTLAKNALLFQFFNLPGWDWKTKTLKPNCSHPNNHYKLLEVLEDNGLTQTVEELTRNQNTLDLIVTNLPSKITQTDIIPGISDHDIVYKELDINPVIHKQTPRLIPIYKKAQGNSIRADLQEMDNDIKRMAETNHDLDSLWNKFSTYLLASINKHIPHKTTKPKDSFPWIDKEKNPS